ncbi:daptide biosynthesis intramembrane metalloprotease [Microbacterium sp. NPDC091662]|uniref:daptide biosynthesis intramembrane metalloprotease n=1 Tax=Microbacterium sp. NPDC091662 TaxID=3364211 RepID=UPI00382B0D64
MHPSSSPRRRSRAEPLLDADACPRLSSGVAFEEVAEEEVWIAVVHGVPSSRVSPTVVDLLRAMNGETALRDLHGRFAEAESLEGFLRLAQRFRASGLLEGDTKLPPGRLTYRPPFTLQIATLRASGIFRRLDHLVVPMSRRVVLISITALLVLGLLAAILQARELLNVLTMPVPLTGLVVLVAALSLMTLLHEAAHGLTLTRFGGRPRRAGFMLFYLTPAFFVDVTDGWRLPERRQRVAIALAGPAVHAAAAAVALLAALAFPQPVIRQTLLLLALSCVAIVLVNLIPFVRFDGYIALMSALDEPNLRGRAIDDGASFLARLLFGARRDGRRLDRWWSVPFGLVSLAAPVALVLFAVARTARALAGGGPLLGMLVVALEAMVILVGIVLLARALRRVLRSGVSRLRFAGVGAALIASISIIGLLIPVPLTTTFGFSAYDGRVVLLHAGEDADVEVPDGAPVVLMSNGILANENVGEGTTRAEPPRSTTVPLDALFPVRADGVSVPAMIVAGVEVSEESGGLPPTGQARVEIGGGNLWQTLWATGVMLPLSAPQSEREEEG